MPGIGPSPDKMLLGRLFSYPDTHRYRIGPNYAPLPPNRPHSPVNSYELVREATKLHREDDDFGQAGTMVREVLDPALLYWRHVDKELGDRIAANSSRGRRKGARLRAGRPLSRVT